MAAHELIEAPPTRSETTVAAREPDDARARWLLVVLGTAIAIALVPFIPGLLGAVVLHVCMAGLHRRLSRRIAPAASAFAIAMLTLLLVFVPAIWLVTNVVNEGGELLRRLGASDVAERLSRARIAGIAVGGQAVEAASGFVSWLSGQALTLFGSATRATLNLAIALFGLYYLLVGGAFVWRRVRRLLPFSREVAERLRRRFVDVTEAMLLGVLFTAVLQGTLVGGAFALLGLRAPVLWGVVTACVSVLPLFGSALVWLPGTVVLAMEHRYGAAVGLFLLGAILVSNLDNLVRLVVYKRVSNVHPMFTLVGAFAGVGVFGIAGVLIGPLVLLYFFELLRAYEESRRRT